MGLGRVERVAGSIKIDRQHIDCVEPILLPIGLRLDQQHFLGEPVRGVGLLGITAPQVVFLEGHGGEFRIGADRTGADEFLDAVQPGLLHQLDSHDQIFVEETSRIFAIRADPSDHRGQMNDNLRPKPGVHPQHRLMPHQVVLGRARNTNSGASPRFKRFDDMASKEARTASHNYSLLR